MTDYEKFLELYQSVGIAPVEGNYLYGEDKEEKALTITNDETNPKIGGYRYFKTEIIFTADGKFIKQNFWED